MPRVEKLIKALRVKPGSKVRLARLDPRDTTHLGDRGEAEARGAEDAAEIDLLQDRLYAEKRRALLVILQGTDTSGKDGTIRKVFAETDPLGIIVAAFGRPSEEELAHDVLWRIHQACPPRGFIGIFNRSHYEDVLAAKVRKLAPAEEIEARYAQFNDFERMLSANGTTVLKFMLHISKEEQAERLQARLDDPAKRWKFQAGDLEDRALWDDYVEAYETMLERCSTEHAPWYVVPADRKWARNAAISAIIRATLEAMDPRYPEVTWDPAAYRVV